MTKINLIFILICMSSTVFAQNHRFVYEFSFKIDSLNRENITKELMNLDVSKEGSSFYSGEKQLYDSLMNAEMKKNVAVGSTHIDFSRLRTIQKLDLLSKRIRQVPKLFFIPPSMAINMELF